MATQVSYPGVYIEEFAPGAPIQGASTSTTAFIGVASGGELNTPFKLTSWDAFKAIYGAQPVPGFYLWHSVHGYFQNGGQVCYIVRASNGSYGKLPIKTKSPVLDVFTIRVRQPGAIAINAGVALEHVIASAATQLYQLPAATALTSPANIGDTQIVLSAADAAPIRPGDVLTIAGHSEHLQLSLIHI